MRPVKVVLMCALATCATVAHTSPAKPLPLNGELLLDMDNPVIELKIGAVKLQLRVGLEQKSLIELNPAAADRIRASPPDAKFRFEEGFNAEVGRETLKGITATAPVRINRRDLLVTLSSHGRDCCAEVDGEIGLGLLPYATIRFVRAGTNAWRRRDFLIDDNDETGPQTLVPLGRQSLFVQFSLNRADSVATSSAGAILARSFGGRLGKGGTTIAAFGIARPTTTLSFTHPARIAGFRFERLPVRTADFAGNFEFPVDSDDPERTDDIVVRKRIEQQRAWPVVIIGRDRLDACSEALYDARTRRLTLTCAAREP